MIKKTNSDYGGKLRNARKGRVGPRPVSTKHTMHLILKSSQATGDWNFARPRHASNIRRIVDKFAFVYGIQIVSFANAWNHLHLQIKLSNRFTYGAFIRAITGAVAMSVTGRSRWTKNQESQPKRPRNSEADAGVTAAPKKFWDHRPFTRIADNFRAYLNLRDYVRMNEFEAKGFARRLARGMVQTEKLLWDGG